MSEIGLTPVTHVLPNEFKKVWWNRHLRIALQTAIGGIVLSTIGMILAVFGLLPPVAGAMAQEVIDVLAILNATRVGMTRKALSDFKPGDSRQ